MQQSNTFEWNSDIVGLVFGESLQNYSKTTDNLFKFWYGISKINLIVGPNNSGKSKTLREIMRAELRTIPRTLLSKEGQADVKDKLSSIIALMNQNGIASVGEATVDNLTKLHDKVHKIFREEMQPQRASIYSEILDFYDYAFSFTLRKPLKVSDAAVQSIKELAEHGLENLSRMVPPAHTTIGDIEESSIRVYIPVLRGIRKLGDSGDDYYSLRTIADYNLGKGSKNGVGVRVFSGLGLHQLLTDQLLGGLRQREEISQYQNFLSRTVFEGQPIALIPPKNKQVTIKVGSEQEQEIHNLGDGLQSILALTFLPFLYHIRQQPAFFFIEEPELFLHPGSQRRILEIFNELKTHTYFITTHSNHLLDVTMDFPEVTISSVRKTLPQEESNEKIPTFQIQPLDTNTQSTLALLGIRNSSVFLVNATIWVEGITDRWYLRTMLTSYMATMNDSKKDDEEKLRVFREDAHYGFVEYGGANITHFSFLDSEDRPVNVETLCGEPLVIVDNDNGHNKKRKDKLRERLGKRVLELECREVENLLPSYVIRQVIATKEGVPVEAIPDFDYERYRKEYLGTFIETKVLPKMEQQRTSATKYRDNKRAGTITSKRRFAEMAVKYLEEIPFEALPKSTKALILQIYQHIKDNNPK